MAKESATFVKAGKTDVLDLFGPKIESLTSTREKAYCVIKATIPAGASVPLHSHPDAESFYVLSGEGQSLVETAHDGFVWQTLRPGDFVDVTGGAKHAWRNLSAEPFETIIIVTPKLGQFLRESGRPLSSGCASPPTPEEMQDLIERSARYGYWMASPEENAAVGISLL
jgi:quercetin dioxygenase-like cupin family protein